MTVTVGRFSTSNAFDYQASGDAVTINGTFSGDTDDARAARMQLLGLAVGDVVPFTSSDLPELDGFYHLSSAVSVSPSPLMLSNGYFEYSVSMTRPPGGYGVSTFEVTSLAALRDIDDAYATWRREVYWPESATWVSYESTDSDREGCEGWIDTTPTAGAEMYRYQIAPANYFEGAATIEVKIGASWYPLVGTHLPAGTTAADVRVGNAQTRFTVIAADDMRFDLHNGTSWQTSEDDFTMPDAVSGDWSPADDLPVAVLRNDPASVSVRFLTLSTNGSVDIAINRGAVGITGTVNGSLNVEPAPVYTTTLTGASNVTDGGIVEGAPAGSDPAYFITADDVVSRTASTVTGAELESNLLTSSFSVGYSLIADGHAQEGHDAFYGSNAVSQRLVLP